LELPERLIVVGSGVTGAEFASGYAALGVQVVLVSSVTGCVDNTAGSAEGPAAVCAGRQVRPGVGDQPS
jgi:hypothetical protein